MTLKTAALVGCMWAASACKAASPTEGEAVDSVDAEYPENRGLNVSAEIQTGYSPWWERDSEIVFIARTSSQRTSIRAVPLQGGAARTLDFLRTESTLMDRLVVAPDGVSAYYLAGADGRSLYYLPSNGVPILVEQSSVLSGNSKYSAFGNSVITSSDSRTAVYVAAPDSLRRFDVMTRTSYPLSQGCTGLHTFSPDGRNILCSFQGSFWIVSLNDGARRLASLPPRSGTLFGVHWGQAGMLVMSGGAYYRMEIGNGTTGEIAPIVDSLRFRSREFPNYTAMTWSGDGRHAAFTTTRYCRPVGPCSISQRVVYVADIVTRELRRVAVINFPASSSAEIGGLVFSPDHKRIAYVAGTHAFATLYAVNVR